MRANGFTLIELIVVLAILGILASIPALALAPLSRPRPADSVEIVHRARGLAAQRGEPVTWQDSAGRLWRALPDGRVLEPGKANAAW